MIASGCSFKLLKKEKIAKTTPDPVLKTERPADVESDSAKRSFLKMAGVVGAGAVAVSLLPKKAEALVFGSSPTSSTVGVKNVANARVNPATQETLAAIKAQSDLFTFDGVSNPANLKVNVAAGDVGLQNASNVTINPATEDTLALIKAQADKLTFDVSNNLLTASAGGEASTVGVKDKSDTQIDPATDDSIVYLRRMVKLMESQATVDSANRQRVTIDSLGTGTAVTTTIPVSGSVSFAAGSSVSISGQNQQIFQDAARTAYATSIRQNLIFT